MMCLRNILYHINQNTWSGLDSAGQKEEGHSCWWFPLDLFKGERLDCIIIYENPNNLNIFNLKLYFPTRSGVSNIFGLKNVVAKSIRGWVSYRLMHPIIYKWELGNKNRHTRVLPTRCFIASPLFRIVIWVPLLCSLHRQMTINLYQRGIKFQPEITWRNRTPSISIRRPETSDSSIKSQINHFRMPGLVGYRLSWADLFQNFIRYIREAGLIAVKFQTMRRNWRKTLLKKMVAFIVLN